MLVPLFIIPDRKIYPCMGTTAFLPGQSANSNCFGQFKHILKFKHLHKIGVEYITRIKDSYFFESFFKFCNILYTLMQQGRLSENTDI